MFGLPAAPTAFGVLVVAIFVGYLAYRVTLAHRERQDDSANKSLHREIEGLRESLARQAERHSREIGELNGRLDEINKRYDEERSIKHKAINDVSKTVMALDLVQRLAKECSCGVLGPLLEIVDRLVADLATYKPPTGGTSS